MNGMERRWQLLIVLAALAATPLAAQVPPPPPVVRVPGDTTATVFRSVQFDLPSRIVGRTFRIYVGMPLKPPPPAGYPVVTLLDGNGYFPVAVAASLASELSGDRPALTVGIGYPTDDINSIIKQRGIDLTAPLDPKTIINVPGLPTPDPAEHGGAAAFQRFLLEELRPALAARYKIDPARQALFGHSFGALFGLRLMFDKPESFQAFLLISPSIDFGSGAVLAGEPVFVARVKAGAVAPRVFIGVGADEQSARGMPGASPELAKILLEKYHMVDNARALASRLSAIKGAPGYTVRYHEFTDENHGTVAPSAIMRAMRFALVP